MKLSSASVLLTAVALSYFFLTGCFDSNTKIVPNNWNCKLDTT